MKVCLICEMTYAGRRSLCVGCWTEKLQKELNQVKHHNNRALAYDKEASLTLKEWLITLEHFNWMCAYCLKAPYQTIDHFIPFNTINSPLNTIHKGTSADNCVPCCKSCNSLKNDKSPEYLLKFFAGRDFKYFPTNEMIFRIADYLKIRLLNT